MTDNLAEMIKEETIEAPTFNEADLNIPEEAVADTSEVAEPEEIEEIVEDTDGIKVTSLIKWIDDNYENFENIGLSKISINKVDNTKTIILAADLKDSEYRWLHAFNTSDTYPILDIPGLEMEIHKNVVKILFEYNQEENIYIKTYSVNADTMISGIFVVFCNKVDEMLLPYNVTKLKMKDKSLNVVTNETLGDLENKLNEIIDPENMQILYPPIAKSISELITKKDTIKWLLEKQDSVVDINHLLKIDNIIIDQLV